MSRFTFTTYTLAFLSLSITVLDLGDFHKWSQAIDDLIQSVRQNRSSIRKYCIDYARSYYATSNQHIQSLSCLKVFCLDSFVINLCHFLYLLSHLFPFFLLIKVCSHTFSFS